MLNFNKLSRAEMKNVLGGYMPVGGVSCIYSNTTSSCGVSDKPLNCDGANLDACQNAADDRCMEYDCCADATCKYV